MHYNFKQAVCLEKKDYARGVHELSESCLEKLSQNETFLQYKRLGLIEESKMHSSTESMHERNVKLAESVLAPKVEAAVEAEAAKPMDDSSIEAAVEEVKEQASSKKTKKR